MKNSLLTKLSISIGAASLAAILIVSNVAMGVDDPVSNPDDSAGVSPTFSALTVEGSIDAVAITTTNVTADSFNAEMGINTRGLSVSGPANFNGDINFSNGVTIDGHSTNFLDFGNNTHVNLGNLDVGNMNSLNIHSLELQSNHLITNSLHVTGDVDLGIEYRISTDNAINFTGFQVINIIACSENKQPVSCHLNVENPEDITNLRVYPEENPGMCVASYNLINGPVDDNELIATCI